MQATEPQEDELLVVEAPHESAPTSPLPEVGEHHDEFFGHSEGTANSKGTDKETQHILPVPVSPGVKVGSASSTTFDDILNGQR